MLCKICFNFFSNKLKLIISIYLSTCAYSAFAVLQSSVIPALNRFVGSYESTSGLGVGFSSASESDNAPQ